MNDQNNNPPRLTKRELVWLNAWCSVANANDCERKDIATSWADECLREFDIRFGKT